MSAPKGNDYAVGNPGGGRPTDYDPKYAEIAAKACEIGYTDKELADLFDVSVTTIGTWKLEHKEFSEALKTGKHVADERVERSLYHKAIGYSFDSEKVFQFQGSIVRAKTVEHVPPDTTACIFWLKNRRQHQWRDVHKHEHGGVGDFDKMTDEQLREYIQAGAIEASASKVLAGPSPGNNGVGNKPH